MARIEVTTEGQPPAVFPLPEGRKVLIGRSPRADLSVEKDAHLSQRHAEALLERGRLKITRIAGSLNPVSFGGAEKDEFVVEPGGSFTIGKTRFRFLVEDPVPDETVRFEEGLAAPVALETLTSTELYKMGEPSAGLRLQELLELPDMLTREDREGLYAHIAHMLRVSTGASWGCIVTEQGTILGESSAKGSVTRYRPSRTLIQKAIDDAPHPTRYSWLKLGGLKATVQEGLDWAICAAARIPGESPMVFYVSGKGTASSESVQRDYARFVGLVADIVGRSFSVDRLLVWKARFERFFAKPVAAKILNSPDLKALEPKLAQSTVLFFDIRGFSAKTEEKHADILPHIAELRRVMTAMTAIVLEENGALLQYLGDGFVACWNVPFEDPEHIDRACRSALRMIRELSQVAGGWKCGIGIHTGEVVAGAIGSEQVFSYSLIGGAVNQASRIEGITKFVGASVLVTGQVAEKISEGLAAPVRLGRFRPSGMSSAVDLYELLPPPADPRRGEALARGLSAFEAGRWEESLSAWKGLAAEDRPAAFLRSLAQENLRQPPARWDGTIDMGRK